MIRILQGRLVHQEVRFMNEPRVVVEGAQDEDDVDYYTFRAQLIEHYNYCHEHKLVEWLN